MDWTLELWTLKILIVAFVIICDIFGIKFANQCWNQKRYDLVVILGILFVAQNIMLIETVISISKHLLN